MISNTLFLFENYKHELMFVFLLQNVFLQYQKLFQECQQQQVRLQLLQEQRQREAAAALLLPQHPLLMDMVNGVKVMSKSKNGNSF
jgi:hypothetical protein